MKSLRPFILIAIAIATLYMYAWPQWNKIAAMRVRNLELQNALAKAQELSTLRNTLLAQYSAIPATEIEKIARVVPQTYDPVKLVTDINAVALRYGMLIGGVKVSSAHTDSSAGTIQEAPKEEPFVKKEISFTTQGQYRNFITFISELERSLQLLDIQKVEITSKQGATKGSLSTLEFKVTLTTYWMN